MTVGSRGNVGFDMEGNGMVTRYRVMAAGLVLAALVMSDMRWTTAAAVEGLDPDARAALAKLYETTPRAKALGEQAKGILVFPSVGKAGFLVGVHYGEGVLFQGDKITGYYNVAGASYGLQAGAQVFAYAMFFMTDSALNYLDKSEGFEVGVGPNVVVLDAGAAKTLTTTTARDDIYAFVFAQKGLMAGLGLQGSKISKLGR
jgi:lipid-binding SYLF domain-containing protein